MYIWSLGAHGDINFAVVYHIFLKIVSHKYIHGIPITLKLLLSYT